MRRVHVISRMDATVNAIIEVPNGLSEAATLEYIREHIKEINFGDPKLDYDDASLDFYYIKK